MVAAIIAGFHGACAGQARREAVVIWRHAPMPWYFGGEFAPADGPLVTTGNRDGLATWDRATLSRTGSMLAGHGAMGDPSFARDAPVVVAVSSVDLTVTVSLFSHPGGEHLADFTTPGWQPDYAIDGAARRVALLALGEVSCWDTASGELLWKYATPGVGVHAIAMSRDGSRVAVGDHSGRVRMLGATGEVVWSRPAFGFLPVVEVDMTEDAGMVFASTWGSSQWRDGASGEKVREFADVTGPAIASPEGDRVAMARWLSSARNPATVEIRRIQDAEVLASFPAFRFVTDYAWPPEGSDLVVFGHDCELPVTGNVVRAVRFDSATGRLKAEITGNLWGRALAISPDGQTVAAVGEDARVNVYDTATGAPRWTRQETDVALSVQFTGAGDALLIASGYSWHQFPGGAIRWRSAATSETMWEARPEGGFDNARLSPDGTRIAAIGGTWMARSFFVLDARNGAVLVAVPDRPEGLVEWISDDLVAHWPTFEDGSVLIYSADDGSAVGRWETGEQNGNALRRAPDGRTLAGVGRALTLWSIPDGAIIDRADSPSGWIRSVNWDATSASLVTGGSENLVHVWSRTPLQPLASAVLPEDGGASEPADAAFTPDGTRIAVLRSDGWTGLVLNPALCRADCDGDGAATPADLACFQSLWRARDPRADFDLNGVFNIRDFTAFQADWARQQAGECP